MKRWAFATLVMIVELVVLIMVLADIIPLGPMPIASDAHYAKFFGPEEAADTSISVVRWLIYLVTVVVLFSTTATIIMELARWALNRRWREHS